MLGQNTELNHEITIKVGGEPLNVNLVELVEFSFDDLIKYYPSDVTYNRVTNSFFVRLTQEETQNFDSAVTVQVRVKFLNGDIPLSNKKTINVNSSLSKAVLWWNLILILA